MDVLTTLDSQIRIGSIGDIKILVERLRGCNIPKLNSDVLSDIVNFIVNQVTHLTGDSLEAGLLVVLTLIDRALLHSYSRDEWLSMKLHLVELLHNILKVVILNPHFQSLENSPNVLQKIGDVFLPVCEIAEIKKEMVESCGSYFLKIVCWEELPFAARLHVFTRLKKTLQESSHSVRSSILSQTPLLVPRLIEIMQTCGDFGFQELLTETLIRFAMCYQDWKQTLLSWFKDPCLAEAAKVLEICDYELSVRKFLNMVNQFSREEQRVYSLPSQQAKADNIVLKKPQGYDELWVDCSPRTGSISLLIDGGSGVWSKVILEFSAIKSIRCYQRSFSSSKEVVCQLTVELSHPILMPLEKETPVSEMFFVFRREKTFLKAEKNYFKFIFPHVYEPMSGNVSARNHHPSARSTYSRTSSSVAVSSLLNATLSTIEKAPELRRMIASSFASRSPPRPVHRRQLTTSTPEKGEPRKLKSCLKRRRPEKQAKRQQETLSIPGATTSRRCTLVSPSIIVDRNSMKNVPSGSKSDLDACLQSGVGSLFTTSPSSGNSLLKFVNSEICPKIQDASAEVSFQPLSIATVSTNERNTSFFGRSVGTSAVGTRLKESSISDLKPFDCTSNCVEDENRLLEKNSASPPISEVIKPPSRHGIDDVDCNNQNASSVNKKIASSSNGGSVDISCLHEKSEPILDPRNPCDFKDLLPPSENAVSVTPVSSSMSRSQNKFFTLRKLRRESSASEEASQSSCSTMLSRKNLPDSVKLKNAVLGCERVQAPPAARKSKPFPRIAGKDPYNFVDEGGRIGAYTTCKTPQRSSNKTLRRTKLFTPGKDDTFELSEEDTSQPPPFSAKTTKSSPEQKNVKEAPIRRSSRRRKEVNYAQFLNSTGSDVVEKLRSEVIYSHSMRKSPPEVVIDENDVNFDLPQPEKATPTLTTLPLSPPSTVPSMTWALNVDLTPGMIKKKELKRGKKNQRLNVGTKKLRTDHRSTRSPEERPQPSHTRSDMPHTAVFEDDRCRDDVTKIAEEPSAVRGALEHHTTDPALVKKKLDEALDLIVNELKIFVPEINRDGTRESLAESLKVNLDSYLASYDSAMKVLREEGHKALTSAVAMQNACEKILQSADVSEEMIKTIENIHYEESRTVAVSIRSNDPRLFSRIRQSITAVLHGTAEATGHGEERINEICDKILEEVKLYMNGPSDREHDLKMVESLRLKLRKCLDAHRSSMNSIREVSLKLAHSITNIQGACDKYLAGAESFAQLESHSVGSWQTAGLSYLRMYFAAMNDIKEDTAKIIECTSTIQNSSELLPFANTLLHVFDGELRDSEGVETGSQHNFSRLRDLVMECLQDLVKVSGER